ncbi:hypothetical protein SPSIL_005760 [Sporomusa silvacetica DSM 10669]|uniref:Cyclophilin-like domain-containing protein n=1 Tax=Sporomusa silvacetica DSM 10669 TaxID=1123289 RepID=A0ABZ3IFK9_9FIRM|nr:cyclophilin-like fold protein [Sporomusa silvacetica]OZC17099.1 hypothetical protein SPSIL_34640 [Sporomusa silvacetica DSM 10669]
MKKFFTIMSFAVAIIAAMAGCSFGSQGGTGSSDAAEEKNNMEAETKQTISDGKHRIKLTFDGGEAVVVLEDNAAARDLMAKLPMTQTFEDFNAIEKICRLPDKIVIDGAPMGVDPDVGDVTLYVPWNTLVFYYKDYGYNKDLVPIGHIESGLDKLKAMGDKFTVKMEKLAENAAGKTKITLTAGDTVIEAELDDNETSKDFIASLPITLPMKRYDDREYYGHIAKLSENGPSIPDFFNGDVTYHPGGPSFAVFFGREEDSYQPGLIRMGRITSDLSLFGKLGESPAVRIEVKK